MSKPDRVSVDIGGLRDQIENFQQDSIWRELTLSKKIRVLIQAGLETRQEGEQKTSFKQDGSDSAE